MNNLPLQTVGTETGTNCKPGWLFHVTLVCLTGHMQFAAALRGSLRHVTA